MTTSEPPAGPDGTVAGDEQELRHHIGQTRERLGQTVEQLAARADVKGQAQARAAVLSGRAREGAARVRARAAERGAGLRSRVAGKTVTARQKTTAAAGAATAQLQARAASAWDAAPEPVRRTAVRGAGMAGRRRVPLTAAVARLIAGYLAGRWRRRQ